MEVSIQLLGTTFDSQMSRDSLTPVHILMDQVKVAIQEHVLFLMQIQLSRQFLMLLILIQRIKVTL